MVQPDLIRRIAAGTMHPPPEAVTRRSVEVRWFYEGEPSVDVESWFDAICGGVAPGADRSDVYLNLERSDANVKLRDGRLEVKRRAQHGHAVRLARSVEGRAERWDKWAIPWPHGKAGGDGSLDGRKWILVGKSRRVCRLSVGEEIALAPEGILPAHSCTIELTRLAVNGASWWSVCFEASAPEDEIDDTFSRAVRHVVQQAEPPCLDLSHSYAYPQWLIYLGL